MNKNSKRVRILLSIGIIIAAVFAGRLLLSNLSFFQPPYLISFKDKEIQNITLTGENKTQVLVPKKGVWYVRKDGKDYRANSTKVETLLNVLHNLTSEDIVSRNKKKQAEFGIGKAKIILKTVDKNYTVYVGSYYLADDAYVRLNDGSEVFVGANMGTVYLNEDFRDLTIPFLKETAGVQSIAIDYAGVQTVLIQSGNTWHTADEKPVADNMVQSYLDALSTLQASDMLVDQKSPEGKPELTVHITKDGKEETASFYPENEQTMLMSFTGGKNIYAVPKVYVSSLEKTEEDFMQPTTQP